ncbi:MULTISPECIES: spore maturation protein [Clostridium]|uniref:spore maturation protein n=1 Tax=Clostridium TaxID=1485 RepID=UPI0002EDBC66|nr:MULTISPECIES: spore maturation protein [Clostridium]
MGNIFQYIVKAIIPIIIGGVVIYGVRKKVKVYECFVEGAKEGLNICVRIFPYLLAMLLAVNCFRASGAMDYFINLIQPVVKFVGIPPEIVPIIFIKPLSGSGAIGVYTDVVKQFGPDSYIGTAASIIMGSTETIFYTITVYFGAIGIKKIRHSLWVALIVDFCAVLVAINLAKFIIY